MSRELELLREVLGGERTAARWGVICRLLERLGDEREVGFDYVRAHLRAWPPAVRRAPERWLVGAGGERVEELALCGCWELRGWSDASVAELLLSPAAAGLVELRLLRSSMLVNLNQQGGEASPVDGCGGLAAALKAGAELRGLSHLTLEVGLNDALWEALSVAPLSLDTLVLRSALLNSRLRVLARAPWFRQLRVLRLRHVRTDVVFSVLSAIGEMPRLRWLALEGRVHLSSEDVLGCALLPGLERLDMSTEGRAPTWVGEAPLPELRFLGLGQGWLRGEGPAEVGEVVGSICASRLTRGLKRRLLKQAWGSREHWGFAVPPEAVLAAQREPTLDGAAREEAARQALAAGRWLAALDLFEGVDEGGATLRRGALAEAVERAERGMSQAELELWRRGLSCLPGARLALSQEESESGEGKLERRWLIQAATERMLRSGDGALGAQPDEVFEPGIKAMQRIMSSAGALDEAARRVDEEVWGPWVEPYRRAAQEWCPELRDADWVVASPAERVAWWLNGLWIAWSWSRPGARGLWEESLARAAAPVEWFEEVWGERGYERWRAYRSGPWGGLEAALLPVVERRDGSVVGEVEHCNFDQYLEARGELPSVLRPAAARPRQLWRVEVGPERRWFLVDFGGRLRWLGDAVEGQAQGEG